MNDVKRLFLGLETVTHLYSGAESPLLKTSVDVLTQYVMDKSFGEAGRQRLFQMEKKLKENIAKLIDASPHEIAFAGNASEAINTLIRGLEIKRGDNVVLNDLEYASVYLPWLKLQKERDIEIRFIKSENGRIDPQRIEESIDERTCLVAISHVSYLNGFRHNLEVVRKITNEKNVPLLVDATQSLGVVPVHCHNFDFMVASSYKWLLGPHGLGVMYINSDYISKLKTSNIGWRSVQSIFEEDRFTKYRLKEDATKFEAGFNNYPALYVLKNSTDLLLNVGISNIEKHVLDVGTTLVEQLKEWNVEVISSSLREERSGNISFKAKNGEEIMNRLEEQQIKVWGGDGRVRISIHLFNDLDDIQKLMIGLKQLKDERLL